MKRVLATMDFIRDRKTSTVFETSVFNETKGPVLQDSIHDIITSRTSGTDAPAI